MPSTAACARRDAHVAHRIHRARQGHQQLPHFVLGAGVDLDVEVTFGNLVGNLQGFAHRTGDAAGDHEAQNDGQDRSHHGQHGQQKVGIARVLAGDLTVGIDQLGLIGNQVVQGADVFVLHPGHGTQQHGGSFLTLPGTGQVDGGAHLGHIGRPGLGHGAQQLHPSVGGDRAVEVFQAVGDDCALRRDAVQNRPGLGR